MDASIVRHDVRVPRPNSKLADHSLMGAPQNLDNLAVGASVAFDAGDVNHDAIAVHGGLRGVAWNVDVAAKALQRPLGNEKAVAVAVHVEPSDGILAAEARGDEMAGTYFHQIALL